MSSLIQPVSSSLFPWLSSVSFIFSKFLQCYLLLSFSFTATLFQATIICLASCQADCFPIVLKINTKLLTRCGFQSFVWFCPYIALQPHLQYHFFSFSSLHSGLLYFPGTHAPSCHKVFACALNIILPFPPQLVNANSDWVLLPQRSLCWLPQLNQIPLLSVFIEVTFCPSLVALRVV